MCRIGHGRAVAKIVCTPDRAAALLSQARDALQDTDPGWMNPQVTLLVPTNHTSETREDTAWRSNPVKWPKRGPARRRAAAPLV